MSTINVLFAVNTVTWGLLKQNFQRDENGDRLRTDLTNSQARKLKANITGYWKVPNIGGNDYVVVSWYIPAIYNTPRDPSSGLKWVDFLTDKWPNKFHIIGAWNSDGSMFGTTLRQVENGTSSIENQDRIVTMVDKQVIDTEATIADGTQVIYKTIQVEEISYVPNGTYTDVPHIDIVVDGIPVYPIHAQFMKIFPDVNGQPASIPAEINKCSGWADRRWN